MLCVPRGDARWLMPRWSKKAVTKRRKAATATKRSLPLAAREIVNLRAQALAQAMPGTTLSWSVTQ